MEFSSDQFRYLLVFGKPVFTAYRSELGGEFLDDDRWHGPDAWSFDMRSSRTGGVKTFTHSLRNEHPKGRVSSREFHDETRGIKVIVLDI